MRGVGDHLSIGERIAFYRQRRGLTQSVLASLVGRSEDWLSKIERGERDIRRLDLLEELASALRITLGDLVGQPVLLEDEHQQDDVPAVRDALMAPQRLSRRLFTGAGADWHPDRAQIASRTEGAWDQYQQGRIGPAITKLPDLIRAAQALEANDARAGAAVSARVHHLAATTLTKIGEADLAWIAAERAMNAADSSDDPLVLASAARAGTHALLAVGRYDDAIQLGQTARTWFTDNVRDLDPAALSLLGMLDLRMATAAARRNDRSTATELLDSAERAADQLGADANHWQTSFGPTNVKLHRLSAALDLGDIAFVTERAPQVDTSPLPTVRQVAHQIDLARALAYSAQDDAAITALLTAEQKSPALVRHNPAVREIVRQIQRRSPVTSGQRHSEILALAERCRAIR
ncbi:helix-turn-helix transcriptional regulator [Kribbella sandramycini]|uniref:Helix-turn-helix transcriptional regulator n=1 Tax=Kribbella sandramycini TaxID=60450 RepID=A0A7Y4L6S8_9ACTN|nr:helix-turn-helix transcriptional regulator [Kribbella sandramycini]MBB6571723.1 transcriptional regulator with XRE-family HTH domain [Kribbella sandramycini]NOL44366.1 helix-turn-helix transcriptional regulator [Kribbella sandramycini]